MFSVSDAMKKLQEYVDDLNANIEKLDCRGPVSKYVLPDENLRGRYAILLFEKMRNHMITWNSVKAIVQVLSSIILRFVFFSFQLFISN